jgi:hypothetical protein
MPRMCEPLSLPKNVLAAVELISATADALEIWLIGSQANGWAHSESDWDLLVFVDTDPSPTGRQFDGIDVIRKGPGGRFLADGMPDCFLQPFSDFQWERAGPVAANYRGKRFIDIEPAQVRDTSDPVFIRTPSKAVLLWSRSH